MGLGRDNFKGKQKTRGTRPRHTQSVCVTVRLFLRAAWPLCLFASLGRWKTGFYALVAFHCGPTPCRQRMKIPCEGRLRQTLKDNRGVRGGCESFFPFSAKHLEKRRFIRDQCWRFSSPPPRPSLFFFLHFAPPISQCTECMENIKAIHQVFGKGKQLLCAKWLSYSSCSDRLIHRFITQRLQLRRSPCHK